MHSRGFSAPHLETKSFFLLLKEKVSKALMEQQREIASPGRVPGEGLSSAREGWDFKGTMQFRLTSPTGHGKTS